MLKPDDLLRPFYDAHKPAERWRVGTEAEKFGVSVGDASPMGYDGKHGIQSLFESLATRFDWEAQREVPDGPIMSLRRDSASITLEPGAQVELSGAPLETIHETKTEFQTHLDEIRAVSDRFDWLGVGFHPLATLEQLPRVPKLRYGVMKRHMPTRGTLALDMMYRTATVQANLDYADEADAMRKLRVALRLQPIVTAMFANSPWVDGKTSGYATYRGHVWLHMDIDRSGMLPFAFAQDAGYHDYVRWAVAAPMFLIRRGPRTLYNTGQTFEAFMRDGFEGERATYDDWVMHLSTLFPEVRLKNTLEVRGADAQSMTHLCALPALWKGLFYDSSSLDAVDELSDPLTYKALQDARPNIATVALKAELMGRPVAKWAEQVVDIALSGLARINAVDADGRDERTHLAPLAELIERGRCPADDLLGVVREAHPTAAAIVEATRLT